MNLIFFFVKFLKTDQGFSIKFDSRSMLIKQIKQTILINNFNSKKKCQVDL